MQRGLITDLPATIEAAAAIAVVGVTHVGGAAEAEELTPPSQSTTWLLKKAQGNRPKSLLQQERETRGHPEHQ